MDVLVGIMITASHNPPKYNGYKVYWEDGAQIVPPTDIEIINEVNKITDFSEIKTMEKEEAIKQGLYNEILEEIDARYMEELEKLSLNKDIINKVQKDFKNSIYTPLHGTGAKPVKRNTFKKIRFYKCICSTTTRITWWKLSNSRLSKSRRWESL